VQQNSYLLAERSPIGPRQRRANIPGLHDTITRLRALREQFAVPAGGDEHLATLREFGSNPGALSARCYIPDSLRPGAALVVVLHGCTQNASGYDRSAGWSTAAEEHGFALLFPEQKRANNANLCFNWFSPEDASRQKGEALSIRQMIAAMQARYGTDPKQVFITGLSAGGAMASVMLATYPEVFAGGAIIAGLPFGTAASVAEAFGRMRAHHGLTPDDLADRVRSAASHAGPWPIVSVWHGTSDATVDSSNAQAIVDQWRTLHRAPEAPSKKDTVSGYPHRVWTDANGRAVVEEYVLTGMGHGTPLSTSTDYGETAGPFMLEAGISSTRRILTFWQINDAASAREQLATESANAERPESRSAEPASPPWRRAAPSTGVQKTIEDALRTAGLMR
jgi:poly(hydroxyalkanoate) depolymerase family esterase